MDCIRPSGAPDETATAMASPVPRQRSALRAKWLVAADGLHSAVRRARRDGNRHGVASTSTT
ncbi:hypothetical protein GR254_25175, partial [Mycobacterium tuberculosis]|nr:hypothetical protein [Mycobacterium tuberculosis]